METTRSDGVIFTVDDEMAVASAGHRLAVGTDLVVGTDLGVETPDLAAGTDHSEHGAVHGQGEEAREVEEMITIMRTGSKSRKTR